MKLNVIPLDRHLFGMSFSFSVDHPISKQQKYPDLQNLGRMFKTVLLKNHRQCRENRFPTDLLATNPINNKQSLSKNCINRLYRAVFGCPAYDQRDLDLKENTI